MIQFVVSTDISHYKLDCFLMVESVNGHVVYVLLKLIFAVAKYLSHFFYIVAEP